MIKVTHDRKNQSGPRRVEKLGGPSGARKNATSSASQIAARPVTTLEGMPRGEMNAAPGGAASEMPRGEMMAAMPFGAMAFSATAMIGQIAEQMPRGEMTAFSKTGEMGTLELPGLWRLTLSPASP